MGNRETSRLGIGLPNGYPQRFLALASILSRRYQASAQDTSIMRRGDTGCHRLLRREADRRGSLRRGPLDLTFIDVNGATLQVFDLTELGGAAMRPGPQRAGEA